MGVSRGENSSNRGGSLPRINIEQSLFTERGWLDLVVELGDADKALGALIRAWTVAQRYWRTSDDGIPKSEWKKQKLNDAIIGKLADDRGDFIYVHGSREQFDWLRQRSEAGKKGGVEGARITNEKRWGKSAPENAFVEIIDDSVERESSKIEQNRPSSSYSLSPSSSSSFSPSDLNLPTGSASQTPARKPKAPKAPPISGETWEAYRGAYLRRYGIEPVRNATVNSQLANFVKRIGQEESPAVASFFISHSDAFYVKSGHAVGLLVKDAESLRTQWALGKTVTMADAREAERRQGNLNAFAKHLTPKGEANGHD